MKFVSQFEAATLGSAGLLVLRKEAFISFSATSFGSQEQRDALSTMRAIEIEPAKRIPCPIP